MPTDILEEPAVSIINVDRMGNLYIMSHGGTFM